MKTVHHACDVRALSVAWPKIDWQTMAASACTIELHKTCSYHRRARAVHTSRGDAGTAEKHARCHAALDSVHKGKGGVTGYAHTGQPWVSKQNSVHADKRPFGRHCRRGLWFLQCVGSMLSRVVHPFGIPQFSYNFPKS